VLSGCCSIRQQWEHLRLFPLSSAVCSGCCWWQEQQQGHHLWTMLLRRAGSMDNSYWDSLPLWTSTYFASAWNCPCVPIWMLSPHGKNVLLLPATALSTWANYLGLGHVPEQHRKNFLTFFKYRKFLIVFYFIPSSSMPPKPLFSPQNSCLSQRMG